MQLSLRSMLLAGAVFKLVGFYSSPYSIFYCVPPAALIWFYSLRFIPAAIRSIGRSRC
jgi:hypothetical protein